MPNQAAVRQWELDETLQHRNIIYRHRRENDCGRANFTVSDGFGGRRATHEEGMMKSLRRNGESVVVRSWVETVLCNLVGWDRKSGGTYPTYA